MCTVVIKKIGLISESLTFLLKTEHFFIKICDVCQELHVVRAVVKGD